MWRSIEVIRFDLNLVWFGLVWFGLVWFGFKIEENQFVWDIALQMY